MKKSNIPYVVFAVLAVIGIVYLITNYSTDPKQNNRIPYNAFAYFDQASSCIDFAQGTSKFSATSFTDLDSDCSAVHVRGYFAAHAQFDMRSDITIEQFSFSRFVTVYKLSDTEDIYLIVLMDALGENDFEAPIVAPDGSFPYRKEQVALNLTNNQLTENLYANFNVIGYESRGLFATITNQTIQSANAFVTNSELYYLSNNTEAYFFGVSDDDLKIQLLAQLYQNMRLIQVA